MKDWRCFGEDDEAPEEHGEAQARSLQSQPLPQPESGLLGGGGARRREEVFYSHIDATLGRRTVPSRDSLRLLAFALFCFGLVLC